MMVILGLKVRDEKEVLYHAGRQARNGKSFLKGCESMHFHHRKTREKRSVVIRSLIFFSRCKIQ